MPPYLTVVMPSDSTSLSSIRPNSRSTFMSASSSSRRPSSKSVAATSSTITATTTTTTSTSSSPPLASYKSIAKLNAEITKLRAMKAFTNAELEESLLNQRIEMSRKLKEEEEKYKKAQRQLEAVKGEIKNKVESNEHTQKRTQMKDEELKYARQESEELQISLDKVQDEYNTQKSKVESLEERITSKINSIEMLLSQQESIVSSTLEFEKHLKDDGQRRINRLYHLLETEKEFQKESQKLRFNNRNGKALKDSMMDQKNKMKSLKVSLELAVGGRMDRYGFDDRKFF